MLMRKFNDMTHFVADLETLDTAPSAVILRAGFYRVYRHAEHGWQVVRHLDISLLGTVAEQIKLGRTISASTLRWWLDPDRRAAAQELVNPNGTWAVSVGAAKEYIASRLAPGNDNKTALWGNGSNFDCSILQSFLGDMMPIPFWNQLCLRTLVGFTGASKAQPAIAHSAIDDAAAQARTLVDIFTGANWAIAEAKA